MGVQVMPPNGPRTKDVFVPVIVGVGVRVNLLIVPVGAMVNEARGGMVVAGVKLGETTPVGRCVGGGMGVTVKVGAPGSPLTGVNIGLAVLVSCAALVG